MDTIRTYIENVFKSLPQTDEVIRIKTQLLGDMEAKYLELREGGTSEHEAVARVIGDFGTIDELLDELDLPAPTNGPVPTDPKTDTENNLPVLKLEAARDFIARNKRTSRLVAIGVGLILIGVAGLFKSLAMAGLMDKEALGLAGVIILLVMIVPAVGLFIYAGSLTEKYRYIEKGLFKLDEANKQLFATEYEQKNPRITLKVAIGVGLCILGAILVIASTYAGDVVLRGDHAISVDTVTLVGLMAMMLLVAIAVFLFITAGGEKGAYDKLLKKGDFTPEGQEAQRVVGAVASVYWPVVVCAYLVWSFTQDAWSTSWIIWPIAGILFGGFAGLYGAIKGVD